MTFRPDQMAPTILKRMPPTESCGQAELEGRDLTYLAQLTNPWQHDNWKLTGLPPILFVQTTLHFGLKKLTDFVDQTVELNAVACGLELTLADLGLELVAENSSWWYTVANHPPKPSMVCPSTLLNKHLQAALFLHHRGQSKSRLQMTINSPRMPRFHGTCLAHQPSKLDSWRRLAIASTASQLATTILYSAYAFNTFK